MSTLFGGIRVADKAQPGFSLFHEPINNRVAIIFNQSMARLSI